MSDEMSPFANFLGQRREDSTAEWLRRVRRDRKIPSAADLPKEELLDHLPYLLDTLIKQLRGILVDRVGSQSHGEVRWRQHYSQNKRKTDPKCASVARAAFSRSLQAIFATEPYGAAA